MSLRKITLTLNKLESLNFEEKSIDLKLNPDRLDVIVPAGRIYEYIIKEISAKEIWVPKLGLADGMVYELLND